MKFKLGTKVMGIKKEGGGVKVEVEAAKGGNKETVRTKQNIHLGVFYPILRLPAHRSEAE